MVKPMTIEEVITVAAKLGMNIEPVWLECKCFGEVFTQLVLIDFSVIECNTFDAFEFGHGDYESFYQEDYGRTWRCWRYEDRPDRNTRNNTPWEDDK